MNDVAAAQARYRALKEKLRLAEKAARLSGLFAGEARLRVDTFLAQSDVRRAERAEDLNRPGAHGGEAGTAGLARKARIRHEPSAAKSGNR